MQIGTVSKASGVSIRMIRHYEEIGLIPPPLRLSGGHRRYDEATVHLLRFIAASREIGMPVEEIRDTLALWRADAGTAEEVRAAARSRADALATRGTALAVVRDALAALIASAGDPARPRHPVIGPRALPGEPASKQDSG